MAQHKPFAPSQPSFHNFSEISDNFRSRSTSISGLVEQWRQLQASLTTVHNSLAGRVKDSDSDDRERIVDLGMKPKVDYAADKMIEGSSDKNNVIELYNRLYDELETKEKRLNEEFARLESKQRLINDVKQEMELKEIEIKEKCEAWELKQVEIKKNCEALELKLKCMNERHMWFDAKEADMDRRCKRIEAKEKELDSRCKKIEAKEKELDKRSQRLGGKEKKVKEVEKELELKEKNLLGRLELKEKLIDERGLAIMAKERHFIVSLESKEKEMEERCRVIKVNEERAMNEICRAVEWRLKRMNEGFNAMEREGKHGLVENLRGKEISVVNEGVSLKGKEVVECCISDHCHELEKEGKQVKASCESLELLGTRVVEYIEPPCLYEDQINESSTKLESSKEKQVEAPCDDLELVCTQVVEYIEPDGLVEDQINESSIKLESCKEKQVEAPCDELELVCTQVVEYIEPDGLVEDQINESSIKLESCKEKQVEAPLDELELVCTQVVEYIEPDGLVEDKINESSIKLESCKEKQVEAPCDELELVCTQVVEYIEPDGLIEDKINESSEELELKEKEIAVPCEDLEVMETRVNECIGGTQGLIMEQINELKEKEVNGKALELRANHDDNLTTQLEGVEAKEALLSCEDAQLEIKQIGDNGKVAEEHIVTCCPIEPECELPGSNAYDIFDRRVSPSSVEVYSEVHMLCKKLDLNGMRSYMCTKEHNILHDNILAALKSAPDPAKLVLDTSWSFFETGLDEVDNDAIRTRCIYLLEQLIKLSPPINPDVEHEAREFAAFWKGRLSLATPVPITHFGYLHLLAAYKLAKSYKGGLLLSCFKTSYFAAKLYPPEKNVDLCCALGVQDEIPDFVRSLIQRQKHLEAVKCISLFKMECDFPPVQLVEAYLELVKQKLDEKLNTKNFPKVDATAVELSHLRGALGSIRNLKLELVLPTDSLSLRIKELEMQTKKMAVKSSRKRYASSSEIRTVQLEKRPRMASGVAPCPQSWSFN
ncbi:uncharacterized protein LOC141657511 [Silene latifolia]|uniref:uncharacterized protein LOC141657511 n=1 Tax=Silene latifolia TaxID=37657 RepID=UPI003D78559D